MGRVFEAFLPLSFFRELLPFNAELLSGNSMIVRACGIQPNDGSILRSKGFLLFRNGLATLATRPIAREDEGYVMVLTQKMSLKDVEYWEIKSKGGQDHCDLGMRFEVSTSPPDPDEGKHIVELVSQEGKPGQYIFLSQFA
jgi:hypothetical protein